MPFTNLNLSLPTLSDTYSAAITKVATALTAIEDDIALAIVPSMILVNTPFSFNGMAATNLGSALFVDGNTPTAPGSVYYHSGEFFAIDATGTIQLTSLGALNAAAVGGIVGDYGGANPAKVTMVALSGEFQFTETAGVFADLVCDDVVLKGANGSIRLGCDTGITSNKSVLFNDLPASGISALVYDASTSRLVDAKNTRATNIIKVTDIEAAGDYKHTSTRVLQIPAIAADLGGNIHKFSAGVGPYGIVLSGGTGAAGLSSYPILLKTGDQITAWTIYCRKTSDATNQLGAQMHSYTPSSNTFIDFGFQSNSANNPGAITLSQSGLTSTIAAGTYYWITVGMNAGAATTDESYLVEVTYKRP